MRLLKSKNWSCQALAIMGMMVCMSFAFTKTETASSNSLLNKEFTAVKSVAQIKMSIYDSLDLNSLGLSRQAFEYALTGFTNLLNAGKIRKDNLLTILDFSLPSGKKRLFVIDLASGELVFNTYAAHGRNSGTNIATKFSNETNSYQSSLGFYITGETYTGKHGCSLRLEGEEEGINDNALARGRSEEQHV